MQWFYRMYFAAYGWLVLLNLYSLTRYEAVGMKYLRAELFPRTLVIHAVRHLGLICERCPRILEGQNGLFAFTHLCNMCATSQLKASESPYVDAVIRFYLSGDDFITSRGYAFLSSPFWVCEASSLQETNDTIVNKHGSVFELAQRIFEEKVVVA